MPKHRIVAIGALGFRACYLDMTRDQALERYAYQWGVIPEETDDNIYELEFDDTFSVFDIWPDPDDGGEMRGGI